MGERSEQPVEDTSAEWWEKNLPSTGVVVEIPQPLAETPTHSEEMGDPQRGDEDGGAEAG